jgi:glycosyltransferase involved in cell wall biosynthesis
VCGIKVLNISSNDEAGGRWNGFDAIEPLLDYGIESKIAAFWARTSTSDKSIELFPGRAIRLAAQAARVAEQLTGRQATFQFWSNQVLGMADFKNSDLIHLQIVHDHLLTLSSIRRISMEKPTVWTWHDLWPITGHCISPVGCPRWEKGCGNCPALETPIAVSRDRTRQERARKERIFSSAALNIHVSTNWMLKQVEKKVENWNSRIFQFPFGVDNNVFKPSDKKSAKRTFGISEDAFVVAARATTDDTKGFKELVLALEKVVATGRKVMVLTVQQEGLVEKISKNVPHVELPWTNDIHRLNDFYNAADVFAMPSKAETFGMMTLEAMACGVPAITVNNTATKEVADCVDLEVSPENLAHELAEKISWCYDHPEELRKLGEAGRQRAVTHYSLDLYFSNLRAMYEEVIRDHKRAASKP